ncbi:MAG: 8-amino-7-oxononanoate synthase [Pelagibacterales bacterium]|nr:8-amino-7-oxononanoate synthase [Pelagibacterales bacterium]
MKDSYSEILKKQKEQNLYRKLVKSDIVDAVIVKRGKKKFISFASNDYFGLSQKLQVKKAAIEAIKKYGVGAGASRYVTGNNSLYKKLEKKLSEVKNCEDAIVFSSGYSCAIGVIPALVGEGDLVVADRLIHSSLIDGVKLSGAKMMRFLHNDVLHAYKILQEQRNKFARCIIITETVFSMDGDCGLVGKLRNLAEEFGAMLVVDDAHGLFVKPSCYPERSEGSQYVTRDSSASPQNDKSYFLTLGTLSKAIGCVGGYVAGDREIIDYLRNFAKSQIYSTALPPSVIASALCSIKIIKKKNLAEKTLQNAKYFSKLMKLPNPQSAIFSIIIGDSKKTLEIAKKVEEKGFLIGAIRYPTVEKNKARLRITFSSEHKKSDIRKLANILLDILWR